MLWKLSLFTVKLIRAPEVVINADKQGGGDYGIYTTVSANLGRSTLGNCLQAENTGGTAMVDSCTLLTSPTHRGRLCCFPLSLTLVGQTALPCLHGSQARQVSLT